MVLILAAGPASVPNPGPQGTRSASLPHPSKEPELSRDHSEDHPSSSRHTFFIRSSSIQPGAPGRDFVQKEPEFPWLPSFDKDISCDF